MLNILNVPKNNQIK